MENYRKSDYFERIKAFEQLKLREQELKNREFRLEIQEKLLSQDQKIEVYHSELKAEIHDLREKYGSLKEFLVAELAKVNAKYDKEILQIKSTIQDFRVQIKEQFLDMKHQFGQEILRIDRNAMQTVNELQKYAQQVEHYRKESEYIQREAQQMQRDAKFILKRANHQYEKVAWHSRKMKDQLDSYQGKMQVDFQKQKLLLDEITLAQHNKLKDICFEKMGSEILQKEVMQRINTEKSRVEMTKKDIQVLHQKISTERNMMKYQFSNQQRILNLENQLTFAKEKLLHQSNRMELQKREASIINMYQSLDDRYERNKYKK